MKGHTMTPNEWARSQSDEQLFKLFRAGLLGNVAQSLGVSGKGTFDELLRRIRKATRSEKEKQQ